MTDSDRKSLLQIESPEHGRRVAVITGETARLLETERSVYELAIAAIESGSGLKDYLAGRPAGAPLPVSTFYGKSSGWRILPCFDHPSEPTRCLVSGTGLTHRRSAQLRQDMHAGEGNDTSPLTDSMRMYQWGVENGRPAPGKFGAAPEWFFKGDGRILRGHGEPLEAPPHSEDGGEEAELVGIYLIDSMGRPRRVGMAQGNEFSDHVTEEKNYLYLASSKLRNCSIGPELILDAPFDAVAGRVRVMRGKTVIWESLLQSGDRNMCHSLANMEHHHFKHPQHRQPGDVHVYFFGADSFSFQERLRLQDGDEMEVAWDGFGHPLVNPISFSGQPESLIEVLPL